MLREDYRIATLNCGDEDFAVASMRSNLRYGKNQKREALKSHHYIISFDPRDAVELLTTIKAAISTDTILLVLFLMKKASFSFS